MVLFHADKLAALKGIGARVLPGAWGRRAPTWSHLPPPNRLSCVVEL